MGFNFLKLRMNLMLNPGKHVFCLVVRVKWITRVNFILIYVILWLIWNTVRKMQNGNATCRDIYFDNCSFGKHAARDICLHKTLLSEDVWISIISLYSIIHPLCCQSSSCTRHSSRVVFFLLQADFRGAVLVFAQLITKKKCIEINWISKTSLSFVFDDLHY
jgi:hypothetical protein